MILVNGEAVDPDLIEDAFLRLKSEAESNSEISCCERDEDFRQLAEEEVIDGILLAQEAEKRIPALPSEEIRGHLENTLREWREHGASWDMLESQRDEIRADIVSQLRMEKFTMEIWAELPELTDDELRAWHAAHPALFRLPARAKVLHLVRFPGETSADEIWRQLREVREQVLEGADFAPLAREHTEKADGEIDLGWIEHERMLNTFEAMLFSLRQHEVSPVFFYEQAFHLVWIEEAEMERVQRFEEVVEEVSERAEAARRQDALKKLAAELRQTAGIERKA